MTHHLRILSPLLLASFLSCVSQAQVIWDEASNGDFSNDRLNPTSLNLNMGTNGVLMKTSASDVDYFRIHLAPGMQLDALMLVSWAGGDQKGFMALQSGSVFTEPASGTNVANLLGYSHIGPGAGNLGRDLLPFLAVGPGSQGFTPPLKGSDYSFWLNQTNPSGVDYRLDFMVTPEPSSFVAMSAASLIAWKRRKAK